MKTAPTLSTRDLQSQAVTMVSNAIVLHPDLPAEILADEMVDDAEPEFARQFARSLMVGFFTRAIQGDRAKRRRAKIPEQFAHLPFRVRLPDGTAVRLDRLTYAQSRRYYQSLGKRLDVRKANDKKRAEAKALMDALHKPAKKDRGITAGEVLGFDFED